MAEGSVFVLQKYTEIQYFCLIIMSKYLKIHQKVSTSKIQLTNCIYNIPIHLLFAFDPHFAYKLITYVFIVIFVVTVAYYVHFVQIGLLRPKKIQSHLKCCYFQHKKGRENTTTLHA